MLKKLVGQLFLDHSSGSAGIIVEADDNYVLAEFIDDIRDFGDPEASTRTWMRVWSMDMASRVALYGDDMASLLSDRDSVIGRIAEQEKARKKADDEWEQWRSEQRAKLEARLGRNL